MLFCFLYVLGPLAKGLCSAVFSQYGCQLCLTRFDSHASLSDHRETCRLAAPVPVVSWLLGTENVQTRYSFLCLLFKASNKTCLQWMFPVSFVLLLYER